MNKLLIFFLIFFCKFLFSQELNCTITVNSEKLNSTNQQIYKTLERTLTEFVNNTAWTNTTFKQNEKINCSMFILVSSNTSDQFEASIQVQSSRPVFNSLYSTPILNFNDKKFNFKYTEFEMLLFNPNSFESNLVSVISYYCYLILGLDADSFELLAGTPHFETAKNISNLAQQNGYPGWDQTEVVLNRYFLIKDLTSPIFNEIREVFYKYNTGMDLMHNDLSKSKEQIKKSLLDLGNFTKKSNPFLSRLFFDAKSDEIVSIFTGGPEIFVKDLVSSLNKSSPLNSSKWSEIK